MRAGDDVGHERELGQAGHYKPASITDALSAAAERIATVTAPALGSLLEIREKHLDEAVKVELTRWAGMPSTSVVVRMPEWNMRGRVDVVLPAPAPGDPPRPRHVMELKWCQRRQDKVYEAIWDLFKVALLRRLKSVETAHLLTAAPVDLWSTAFCGDIFGGGVFEPEELCSRVFPTSPAGRLAWENLLGGGNDRFPDFAPEEIETQVVGRYPVEHGGLEWELRAVSVHPAEKDVPFYAGWPHGRRPAGPRLTRTAISAADGHHDGGTGASGDGTLGTDFDEAVSLARSLHRHQVRKGTAVPYLSHLLAVASLVLNHGGDEEEAIAALLHDAVEDQGGARTLELIRRTFGERVAEIVYACSDTDKDPKPPWRERKERYLEHLRHTDRTDVLRVSLADKLHNARAIVSDLREHGAEVWSRFATGSAEDQLWYYGELAAVFNKRLPGRMTEELRRTVDELERLASPAKA